MLTNRIVGQWTRRTVLSTGARAAVTVGLLETAPGILTASNASERVLVGVHLLAPAAGGTQLHPAVQRLNGLDSLSVVTTPRDKTDIAFDERYAHLRFIPGGYIAPRWTEGQHTYTFTEGFAMSTSTLVPGDRHNNDTLRVAMAKAPGLPTVPRRGILSETIVATPLHSVMP